jgi:hypothetical protein
VNAAFFSQRPRSTSPASQEVTLAKGQRSRYIHRWVATVFTLTVAANFAAMPWGQPPAWITYAPLPPLLFLMITGLTMLVSSWFNRARVARNARKGAVQ